MKRYRVSQTNERGAITHSYPADAESLALIVNAGGRSQLTDEQRAKVKLKTVGPGDDCTDMPESTIKIFLERGWIEEVLDAPVSAAKPKSVKG